MADIVFAFDPAIDRPIPRLEAAPPAVVETLARAPHAALESAAAIARQSEAAALVLFGRVLDPQRASPAQAAHLRMLVTGLAAHGCHTVLFAADEAARADTIRLLGGPPGLEFVTPLSPLRLDIRGIPVEMLSAQGPHESATAAAAAALPSVALPPTGTAGHLPAPHERRIVVGWDTAHWTGERWDDEPARGSHLASHAATRSPHGFVVWGSRRRGPGVAGTHQLPALQARSAHEAAAGGCGALTLLDHPPVDEGLPSTARRDALESRTDWRNAWRELPTHHVAWRTINVASATGGDEDLATAIWSAIEALALDPQGPLEIIRCHVECGTSVQRRVRIAEISAETLARVRQLYDARTFRAWCHEVLADPGESLVALGHTRSGAKPGSTTSFSTALADIVNRAEQEPLHAIPAELAREAGWAALELIEST